MEELKEAVKYFENNNGYLRLLKGIKNKYVSSFYFVYIFLLNII